MFEDDFKLVNTGLISLGDNRYDIYELYEKEDSEGVNFFYGIYEIKNRGFIAGQADNKEELSHNLSSIARMRNKKMHRFVGARVRIREHWFFFKLNNLLVNQKRTCQNSSA